MKMITTRNSVYEVDETNRRVRLVESINPPYHRFEPLEEWKDYRSFDLVSVPSFPTDLSVAVFTWPNDVGFTQTSLIKSIEDTELPTEQAS